MGSKGQNSTISEHGHVSYQIKMQSGNVATWLQTFCPQPPPPPDLRGQKVKIKLFKCNVMLHNKLKEIRNEETWSQIFCLQTAPIPMTLWLGSEGQKTFFSEHGHVA